MFDYLLFEVTSLGYIEETAEAMAEGIFQSIFAARQDSMRGYGRNAEGKNLINKEVILSSNYPN